MLFCCAGDAANAYSCCEAVCLSASDPPGSSTINTSAVCRQQFRSTTTSVFLNTHFTNHESLPSLEDSYAAFIKAYPQYSKTTMVERIRDEEYYHLKKSNHVCLDYNGIGLFSYSQIHDQDSIPPSVSSSSSSISQHLGMPVFNLSHKSTSLRMQLLHGGRESKLESTMKRRIMDYLNIPEDDYSLAFTANRAAAFKLLADSYPFQTNKKLMTVYDYKSESVEAMISSAQKRGAKTVSAEFVWPRLKIHSSKLKTTLVTKVRNKKAKGLFAFPLQSRVTGSRYPCLWMNIAKENGWHVLFDASALGLKEMNCFGLSLYQPDFFICSFYKVFGDNPSGFGCLFVKKSAISILQASITSSITGLVSAKKLFPLQNESINTNNEFQLSSKSEIEEDDTDTSCSFSGPIISSACQSGKLEQGEDSESRRIKDSKQKGVMHTSEIEKQPTSVNEGESSSTHNVSSKIECRGLDHVDTLGLHLIGSRARYLINWLVIALRTLHHPNTEPEVPLVRIYGRKINFDRSPALAFNIYDWKGEAVDPSLVQKLADRRNISISYAFLQHMWFPEKYQEDKERVSKESTAELQGTQASMTKSKTHLGIKVTTASLGFLTNFEDTYRLWAFIAQFLNADFVEKECWRYTSLNQKTVEI